MAASSIPRRDAILAVGQMVMRNGNIMPLRVGLDGMGAGVAALMATLTVELCMFPFLFSHGTGHYTGAISWVSYCKMRAQQLFSFYTLHLPYLFVLYMIRQAKVMAGYVSTHVLERDLQQYRKKHPKATLEKAFKKVLTHTIPGGKQL